jgi:colanic acid/amylovoran biosynthesis protein
MKKTIKNISLVYCWGNKNLGDKAITPGTIRFLKQVYPDSNLFVLSVFEKDCENYKESEDYICGKFCDVNFVPQPLIFINEKRMRNSTKKCWAVLNAFIGMVALCMPKLFNRLFKGNAGFDTLIKSDLIIYNGGVLFFHNKTNSRRKLILFRLMFPFLLAKRLKIRHAFYGQTYGPFKGISKIFYKWFFSSAELITTRESQSRQILNEIGVKKTKVENVIDGSFWLDGGNCKNTGILLNHGLANQKFIAVILRASTIGQIGVISEDKAKEYGAFFTGYLSEINKRTGFKIAIVLQVKETDQKISENVYEYLGKKAVYIDDLQEPEELIALYSHAEFVVSMRLHSIIFALLTNTPSLALYYKSITHKTSGIMQDLKLEDYVFDIDEVSRELLVDRSLELIRNKDYLSQKIEETVMALRNSTLEVFKKRLA